MTTTFLLTKESNSRAALIPTSIEMIFRVHFADMKVFENKNGQILIILQLVLFCHRLILICKTTQT